MALTHQQQDDFFRLQSNSRYDVTLIHCKSEKDLWVLQDSDGCVLIDLGEEKVLPIWHDEELANSWRTKEYAHTQALKIPFNDFCTKWLPGMKKDGFSLGVSPNLAGEGIVVSAEEFAIDIGVTLEE
ncbi:DUF2750 domain-containing protein [Marinomonas agarivorans]|nr:DUF2750 domain-containing protein [Marinomonas agarivorans]